MDLNSLYQVLHWIIREVCQEHWNIQKELIHFIAAQRSSDLMRLLVNVDIN